MWIQMNHSAVIYLYFMKLGRGITIQNLEVKLVRLLIIWS